MKNKATRAARSDGHQLEFDVPYEQLGFLGAPFKEASLFVVVGVASWLTNSCPSRNAILPRAEQVARRNRPAVSNTRNVVYRRHSDAPCIDYSVASCHVDVVLVVCFVASS